MGIVGYLKWNNSQGELFSKKLNLSQWGFYLCVGTSLSFLMGYVFKWIGNVSPYVDGFTAVFSVIATWLTIQKFSDNWLIWIVINLLLTYMFFMQGLKINASLFFVYFILSFFGWLKWKKT